MFVLKEGFISSYTCLSKYSFRGLGSQSVVRLKMCVSDTFPPQSGRDQEWKHSPGKAKLCKLLTLQRPKKDVLHFTYVTPQRRRKKKQHLIPCSPLPPLVFSIDARETESSLKPQGQIPLHFSLNRVSQLKSLARKQSCLKDVGDWLYKHSVCHPGRQTVLRLRLGYT